MDLVKQGDIASIAVFYNAMPRHLIQDCEFVLVYSRYLLSVHEDVEAERRLRQCIRKEFNDEPVPSVIDQKNSPHVELEYSLNGFPYNEL